MDNNYEIKKYEDGEINIDVRFDKDKNTIWLNQSQLCQLFNVSKSTINEHLKNISKEKVLEKTSTVRNFRTLANNKKYYNVEYYNLEIILDLNNRVKSQNGLKFKEWVEKQLDYEISETLENTSLIQFRYNEIVLDVNVSPDEDTVWLTKEQMALLFGRDRTVITRHINNIYKEGELDRRTSVHFLHISTSNPKNRPPELYNLDVIISVGYRVKSTNGVLFRQWAHKILREYLLKGYVINENRVLITDENFTDLVDKVKSIDSRLKKVENNESNYKKETLIVEGKYFDAVTYLEKLVTVAQKNILLIDPYVDSKALNILKNSNDNVIIKIITSNKSKLSRMDINLFYKQYKKEVLLFIIPNLHRVGDCL